MKHPIFGEDPNLPVSLETGRSLVAEFDCGDCHAPGAAREGPGIPPDLSFAGSRYQRTWITGYLLKPYPRRYISDNTRPKVKMPNFRLNVSEAGAIADYFLFHKDTSRVPVFEPAADQSSPDLVAEGKKLFEQYQCINCHMVANRGARVGPALDAVGQRLKPAYIKALLTDPKRIVPGTAMKDNKLWESEVDALVAYLMTL